MTHRFGTRLGDFEIVRELGRGGMGVVYEARQISLNRRVALKVLTSGLGLTSKAVQRFRREAEAAAKLHHTNIVPVYANGEVDGTHFYAMELIDGPSLDQVIGQMRQGNRSGGRQPPESSLGGLTPPAQDPDALPAPELIQTGPYIANANIAGTLSGLSSSSLGSGSGYFDAVARMVAEVADALEYAHQQGVIHRDIKPSNLLLSPAGRLSVNDFGLARMLEQPGMTMTGEFVGTPAYMSPEQITAGRIPLDHRTDIYSLGATLYELLTLHPPFSGASREQVLAQIVQKEPKPPRRLRKNVPVDLETICLKCLEKDPDRRYPTAGALAEDLRRYLNRFAISARRAGPITKVKKWAKRNPALAASCLVAVLALATTALFSYRSYRGEQERRAQQEKYEHELQIERQERAFDNAMTEALSGNPKRAEKAFRAAEAVDLSPDRIRLLRGLAALQSDDLTNAIPDLELAVERMSDSFAAKKLLFIAYYYAGRFNDAKRADAELQQLTPSKTEDFFLRAWFTQDRAEAVKDLDEAINRRDTPIARAFRAHSRCLVAFDRSKLKQMEQAIQEIQPIRLLLPDNSLVIASSLRIHMWGGFLYGEEGNEERRQILYKQAEQDARHLQQIEHLPPVAKYILTEHYRLVGDDAKRCDLVRKEAEKPDSSRLFANYYSFILYEQGDYRKALKFNSESYAALTGVISPKIFLVAESQGPAEANKACQQMERDYLYVHANYIPLLFLGRAKEARAELRELREGGKIKKPSTASEVKAQEAMIAYFCEEISEKEYLHAVSDWRHERSRAEWYIGMTHLAAGDRSGAREHFQKSIAIHPFDQASLSRGMLARQKRDPNWPPWIPVRK